VSSTRVLPVSADEAWDLVTDSRNHARWIPLTRVEASGPAQVGDRVRAVSGPGATRGWPGLVDAMIVTRADPPGPTRVALFVKQGPVLLGEARITVVAAGPHSSRVTWDEDVYLAHMPQRVGRALVGPVLRAMVSRVLAKAAREAAQRNAV